MNLQMQDFVKYVRTEMLSAMQHAAQPGAAMVPLRRPVIVPNEKSAKSR
jgi:MerR family transcriptional regulator/heat shock protein HspR